MITSYHYCHSCGAANEPERSTCFACQKPLEAEPTTSQALKGRYEILTCLGTGGYSSVYRVHDRLNPRRSLALKQINLSGLKAEAQIEATDTFNREVSLLSSLASPHLPRIYDKFSDTEHWYVVMDLIDGETLDLYFQRQTRERKTIGLPLETVLEIGIQLCNVLDYLHTRQPPVIFRDLKPGNIIRNSSGQLFLIDFGIARHFSPGKTRDTIPLGSPGYAAPEQYGKAQTTPQSDIYGLGALLYFLLTGDDPAEHPFQFSLSAGYVEIGTSTLRHLLERMVAMQMQMRPENVRVVKQELENIAKEHLPAQSFLRQRLAPAPPPASTLSWYTPPGMRQVQIQQQTQKSQGLLRKPSRRAITIALLGSAAMLWLGPMAWNNGQNSLKHRNTLDTLDNQNFDIASFSPDGEQVALYSYATVDIWNISSRKFRPSSRLFSRKIYYSLSTSYMSYSSQPQLSWSSDGRSLAVVKDRNLALLSTSYYNRSSRPELFPHAVNLVSWSPTSRDMMAVVSSSELASSLRGVQIWSLNTRDNRYTYQGHVSDITAIEWSQGSLIASGDKMGFLHIWGVDGTLPITFYDGHRSHGSHGISAISWSPTNTQLASASSNGIHVLRRETYSYGDQNYQSSLYSLDFRISEPHSDEITALAWSPGESYFASASKDGTVRIWSGLSGNLIATYEGHDGPVNKVAWINSQTLVSAGADKTIQVWRIG